MTTNIPMKINSRLTKTKGIGSTFVFDFAVTKATHYSRAVLANQSTSALVPHSDAFISQSVLVTPTQFHLIPEYKQKHFCLIEAPHAFKVDFGDSSLMNSITFNVKRMFCFPGSYNGRLTIRTDIEQTIKISYA